MTAPVLHLASASPRRRDILTALDIPFTWRGVDIDESRKEAEGVEALVCRLAIEKALAGAAADDAVLPVLGADTIVALDDAVFGKPASEDDALAMLGALSGKAHSVLTAVALVSNGSVETALSTTEVRFRDIRPDEARAYWHSGEPRDKAGAYAIQGHGAVFVASISGSYSGVVGLPVFETARLLEQVGIRIFEANTGQ